MKIGILTFHRAHNYGAVLQCYALQETFRRKGHEVFVIDYRQPWIEEFYKIFSIRLFAESSDKMAYVRKVLKKFILSPFRSIWFRRFRNEFMSLTDPCGHELPQDFDLYVVGSDQLWSLHCLGGKSDAVYMGDFQHPLTAKVVGYAVSADMKSVELNEKEISRNISNFSLISMREAEVAAEVERITSVSCDVCLDPTLLTDSQIWEPVIDDKWKGKNYVLMYEVRWRKESKGLLRRKADELAASIGGGCTVIDLSTMKYSVRDFVSLFRYARYVVTTSFHGIVFSILFERPFYALPLWNGYDLRYVELLHSLGLDARLIDPDVVMDQKDIDYGQVKNKLDILKRHSTDYIDKALNL